MQLFVSYARPDRLRVDTLVTRLRQAGIDVWLDSDLDGGQAWWDKILGQLRFCDAVLAVVSRAALTSQACHFEREYAASLGKPVLPITLESMPAGLFPQDIASIQVIDYSQPSDAAVFELAEAIFALPRPAPLPSPLPAPPPAPQTRFSSLNDRISAPSLTREEQLRIIDRLEAALGPTGDQEDRQTAVEMLSEMAKRPDLYEAIARKIDALQAQAWGRASSRPGKPPPHSAVPRPTGARPSRGRFPNPPRTSATSQRRVPRNRRPFIEQPDDAVSRAVKAAVKPGLITFNPPAEMIQGRTERVEVGIARSPELREVLTVGLRGRGIPQFEEVPTSPFMGVELKGTSFEVTSFSPLEQLVAPTARWEFDVRPYKAGNQTLSLCVSLRVDSSPATSGRIAVPVLEREIRIRVDIGFSTRRFLASNWQWIIATAIGLGGALVAWIALFRLFLLNDFRKKKLQKSRSCEQQFRIPDFN